MEVVVHTKKPLFQQKINIQITNIYVIQFIHRCLLGYSRFDYNSR